MTKAGPEPNEVNAIRTRRQSCEYRISRSAMPPPHLVHPHRLFEALGHKLPAVGEEEAFAGAEATHRVRHEDLPTLRFRGDARRQDHRRAEEIAVFLRWVRRR